MGQSLQTLECISSSVQLECCWDVQWFVLADAIAFTMQHQLHQSHRNHTRKTSQTEGSSRKFTHLGEVFFMAYGSSRASAARNSVNVQCYL